MTTTPEKTLLRLSGRGGVEVEGRGIGSACVATRGRVAPLILPI